MPPPAYSGRAFGQPRRGARNRSGAGYSAGLHQGGTGQAVVVQTIKASLYQQSLMSETAMPFEIEIEIINAFDPIQGVPVLDLARFKRKGEA